MTGGATASDGEEKEFFLVGRPKGGSYDVWYVEPAPTDPGERSDRHEELWLEANKQWGGISSIRARSADDAAERMRREYAAMSGLD